MGGRTLWKEAGHWEKCHANYSVLAPSCVHSLATVSWAVIRHEPFWCVFEPWVRHTDGLETLANKHFCLLRCFFRAPLTTRKASQQYPEGTKQALDQWGWRGQGQRRQMGWGVLPQEYYKTTISVCFLKKKKWRPLMAIFCVAFTLNPLNH